MLTKRFWQTAGGALLLVCLSAISFYANQTPAKPEESQGQVPAAAPQQEQSKPQDQLPVVKERTEVVTLTVTVTDPYNRLVTGLDKQNFVVFEDKIKQPIEFFADEDVPVSLGIIFDVSGSMKGKIERAREALSGRARLRLSKVHARGS